MRRKTAHCLYRVRNCKDYNPELLISWISESKIKETLKCYEHAQLREAAQRDARHIM